MLWYLTFQALYTLWIASHKFNTITSGVHTQGMPVSHGTPFWKSKINNNSLSDFMHRVNLLLWKSTESRTSVCVCLLLCSLGYTAKVLSRSGPTWHVVSLYPLEGHGVNERRSSPRAHAPRAVSTSIAANGWRAPSGNLELAGRAP